MTTQVQHPTFTFDRTTGATRAPFANPEAARKYLDRMGRMDGRQSRAATIYVQTPNAHGAKAVVNFPRQDAKFRAK
jgi:hypothetical protein